MNDFEIVRQKLLLFKAKNALAYPSYQDGTENDALEALDRIEKEYEDTLNDVEW